MGSGAMAENSNERVIANNAATTEAINAAAAAITSTYPSSPDERSLNSCWSWAGLSCFNSEKRAKRIVPASLRLEGGSATSRGGGGWQENGSTQAATGFAAAPPSSPASFANSSAQSPASFDLSLSVEANINASASPPNPMFTIGPYAHETQLVSPPVFSTFTTEPSTAPLTPPSELALFTTPSSPDVPFAQLLASSLEAKKAAREAISPFSASSLASPAGEMYPQYCSGSPSGRLLSPTSGASSPIPRIEFPSQLYMAPSSFPKFDPFSSNINEQGNIGRGGGGGELKGGLSMAIAIENNRRHIQSSNMEDFYYGESTQWISDAKAATKGNKRTEDSFEPEIGSQIGPSMTRNPSVRDPLITGNTDAPQEDYSQSSHSDPGVPFDFKPGKASRNGVCNSYW